MTTCSVQKLRVIYPTPNLIPKYKQLFSLISHSDKGLIHVYTVSVDDVCWTVKVLFNIESW